MWQDTQIWFKTFSLICDIGPYTTHLNKCRFKTSLYISFLFNNLAQLFICMMIVHFEKLCVGVSLLCHAKLRWEANTHTHKKRLPSFWPKYLYRNKLTKNVCVGMCTYGKGKIIRPNSCVWYEILGVICRPTEIVVLMLFCLNMQNWL